MTSDGDKVVPILQRIIVDRINANTLVIPPMPEVATRCMTLLQDTDVDLRAVTKLIERDAVLAARLLRAANSAAMAGETTLSIHQANTRLGAAAVRNLLVDATARQLFVSRDQRIAATAQQLWEHSIAVALMSRDLATILGEVDADAAYLAGLIHDIGKPIAAAILLEVERASRGANGKLTAERWLAAVQGTHREIGVALAEKWELPAEVAQAIRDSSEYDATNRRSLGNVVCFANSVAKLQSIYPGEVSKDEAEAIVMIGRSMLGIEDDVLERLSNEISARVAAEAA